MADWDSLISDVTQNSESIKPSVIEPHIKDSKAFEFGDVFQAEKDSKLNSAMKLAQTDPLKLKAITKNEKKPETAGDKWFNMPKAQLTDEDKRDWEFLHMRSVLDKGMKNVVQLSEQPPEFVQFGFVKSHAMDGPKGRLNRKLRAPTIAESLAKDDNFHQFLAESEKKMKKRKSRFQNGI